MKKINDDALDVACAISGAFLKLLMENAYRCAHDVGKKSADIQSVYHGAMTVMESPPTWVEEIFREARNTTKELEPGKVQGQSRDSTPETKTT